MMEEIFVRGCKDCPDAAEILNWYRNLYYKEPYSTERGITALAINEILPDYVHQQTEIAQLIDENYLLKTKLEYQSCKDRIKPVKSCECRISYVKGNKSANDSEEVLDRLVTVLNECCDELWAVKDRFTIEEFAAMLLDKGVTVRRRR